MEKGLWTSPCDVLDFILCNWLEFLEAQGWDRSKRRWRGIGRKEMKCGGEERGGEEREEGKGGEEERGTYFKIRAYAVVRAEKSEFYGAAL